MTPNELKAGRKKVGVSQDGLARLLKVSKGTVQNWESGRHPISYSMDLAIRVVLENRYRRRQSGPEAGAAQDKR